MAFGRADGGTIGLTGTVAETDTVLVCKSSGGSLVVKQATTQVLPGDAMLNPTGVTSGTYGNSTNIPVIQVDEDGRIISVATTAAAAVSALTTAQACALIENYDYITSANAAATYQLIGDYLTSTAGHNAFLTTAEGDARYAVIGASGITTAQADARYLTTSEGDARYLTTSEGDARYTTTAEVCTLVEAYDYITSANAAATYQPIGDYLTSNTASATYQPIGNYLTTADTKLGVIQVTAARELSAGDLENYLRVTSGLTITIPTSASVAAPVGSQVILRQVGVSTLTVAAGGGVTLNVPVSTTANARGQHATLTLVKASSDEWDLFGDLEVP